MTTFHLTSTWSIAAPIETCWYSILDVQAWPGWWKYVQQVTEINSEQVSESNKLQQFTWNTCLPYQLCFTLRDTRIIPYKLICFEAKGDLLGYGCCKFKQKGNITRIQFEWHVKTNKPWLSCVSGFCKPIFEWNHRRVMQSGEQSLRQRLNLTR